MSGLGARCEHCDWLDLAHALDPGSVDLLYADPPFNTGKAQQGRILNEPRPSGSGGSESVAGRSAGVVGREDPSLTVGARPAEDPAVSAGARLSYDDAWPSTDAWLAWLRERLEATLPAIKPTGSILLHVDWRTSHRARLLLDELLGPDRFVNHLVWRYGLGGSSPRRFARKHDDILFYAIDPERYWFDPPRVPATSRRLRGESKKATDVLDIPAINNMARERTGYPTQKPLALLDVLIRACCPPGESGARGKAAGGLVLDPCCGSGTTLVAAVVAGRRAIGCDLRPEAVRITHARLAGLGEGAETGPREDPPEPGFLH